MGAPPVSAELKSRLRATFKGLFILAGGFDRAGAESALKAGRADLIAFARPILANPDLVIWPPFVPGETPGDLLSDEYRAVNYGTVLASTQVYPWAVIASTKFLKSWKPGVPTSGSSQNG
jgi:hypothetical protein